MIKKGGVVLEHVFSLIGCLFLTLSVFTNSKRNMLICQTGDTLFNAVANAFVGSYGGMLANLVSCVRNLFNITKKNTVVINTILLSILVFLGLCFNDKGIIGFIPVVASVEYTVLSYKLHTDQGLRIALMINLLLWAIHDWYVGLTIAFMTDMFILTITYFNFMFRIMYRRINDVEDK